MIRFKSRVVIHHVVMCGGDGTLTDMLTDEEEIVPADRKKHTSATRSVVSRKQSFNCKDEEEGYLLPTIARKIACRRFD